jgi:outer membrane protein
MMVDLQQKQASREKELQSLGNSIQQKLNANGYLSEDSYKADVNSFNNKQAQAQNYLANEQQKASNAMAVQEQRLNDSINNFIVDYNEAHHYDAILYKAAGVYFNPSLDITKEVIEGLNKRYKSAASASDSEKK